MQLLYLGKLLRTKYHEFSLKLLIFSMLQYWDIKCKTVTILLYLLIIQLSVYNRTKNKIYCRQSDCLSASETGDTIAFGQQLSTTSFEACELEITVNYFSVYTWIENDSFMRNLTSWPMPFWLILLTEHKVLHCYVPNTICRCLVGGQLYPSFGFSLADSMLSTFQPLSSCTILNHIFLWNFHDFV